MAPAVDVCRICDPWLLRYKSPKRSDAKESTGKRSRQRLKKADGNIQLQSLKTDGLKLGQECNIVTVCTVGKICYFNLCEI